MDYDYDQDIYEWEFVNGTDPYKKKVIAQAKNCSLTRKKK